MGAPHPRGRKWERFARSAVAYYGGVCHICHHGGARQADLLDPHAEHPEKAWDLANIRPAHGAPGNPCLVCTPLAGRKVHCNQVRGALSVARAQGIISEWIAGHGNAPPGGRPKPDPGAGRPW